MHCEFKEVSYAHFILFFAFLTFFQVVPSAQEHSTGNGEIFSCFLYAVEFSMKH